MGRHCRRQKITWAKDVGCDAINVVCAGKDANWLFDVVYAFQNKDKLIARPTGPDLRVRISLLAHLIHLGRALVAILAPNGWETSSTKL